MNRESNKKFDRISRVLTLSMAARLLIVTSIATALGFAHIRHIVTELISDDLGSYVRMWGDRENQVFLNAENSQTSLAKRLTQMSLDPKVHRQKFSDLFEQRKDGTIHENQSIDNLDHPSFFLPKTLLITSEVQQRATLFYDFLDRECYLTLASFSDCWVAMSDGMLGVFYPNREGYSDAGTSEFQKLDIVKNAVNSKADTLPTSHWTDVYFDNYVKKWMISLTTPIQMSDGLKGAIGKDLFLNDLLERTVAFGKPGASNFIFTAQGVLIAHPDFEKNILADGMGVNVRTLPEHSPARRAFELTQRDPQLAKGSIFTAEGPYILAISRLPSPNWFLATSYPQQLVQKTALSASRSIVLLGLSILFIEIILFLILLRRRLEKPIADLIGMIRKVQRGDLTAKTSISSGDEFEILGNSLNDMTFDIQLSRTELEAALKKANEASEAKSQFVANMSHEIRTPLAGILGVTQLLKDTPLTDEQKNFANIIDSSGSTLLSIINQILDVAKVEAKTFELRNEIFSLSQTFQDVRSTCFFGARTKGLVLNFQEPKLETDLWGDVTRLKEVLINLVGNAIKYSDTGTVAIEAQLMASDSKQSTLKFEVRDQGPGIPDEVRRQIFKAFIQGDSSNTRTHGGTGLGLFLCHSIVTMMGGQISLESRTGFGAVFSFTLCFENRAKRIEIAAETPIPTTLDLSSVKPVLVVEDTSFNQLVAQSLLKKIGLKSELAVNGKEAADLFECGRYSIILMDCQMPVMDGYEATRLIREKEAGTNSRVPIVALTAKTSLQERDRCLQSGMNDLVNKPVRLNFLTERIFFWLESTRQI